MRLSILAALFGLAVAIGPAVSFAQSGVSSEEAVVLNSEAFLSSHPDLNNRNRGMSAYEQERYSEALTWFRRAARYADKPSQAMVGEMLWEGQGVAQDRPLAYAWMDLAAERGYPGFTVLRERYWARLDEAQREAAVARGEQVYAEYGDAAARPRIDAVLRRERRSTTGSRTGFVGALQVYIAGPGGQMMSIDGSRFYDRKFWDPDLYQAWHDAVWMQPREGKVDIGEIEPMKRDGRDADD